MVKGVLRPDDARRCVAAGAAAVWVSNHGGRQLDRALPTADGAAGGRRRGRRRRSRCTSTGASAPASTCSPRWPSGRDAVFLGRTPLYALAAAGEGGVTPAAHELAGELLEALRLAGCRDLRRPARDLLPAVPDSPGWVTANSPSEPRVTGPTRHRFDSRRGDLLMFWMSPGSGGTQGREAGRPAPRRDPFTSPPTGWVECALRRPRRSRFDRRGEAGDSPGSDLTGLVRTGKFYQVAPEPGREAELRCALDP